MIEKCTFLYQKVIEKCYTERFKGDMIPSMMENKSFCNNGCEVSPD